MLKDKLQPFLERYNKISELLSDEKITQDIKKLTTLSKEQSEELQLSMMQQKLDLI